MAIAEKGPKKRSQYKKRFGKIGSKDAISYGQVAYKIKFKIPKTTDALR